MHECLLWRSCAVASTSAVNVCKGPFLLPSQSLIDLMLHRVSVYGSNFFVTFARVVRSVCGDTTDVLAGRNLVQEIGQHGRITDVAARDVDRLYL
jgi:hypothetical protein